MNLTKRHLEVLQDVAAGLTMKEIAERRSRAVSTVTKQWEEAKRRLNANNSAHAIAIAYKKGIFDASAPHWS